MSLAKIEMLEVFKENRNEIYDPSKIIILRFMNISSMCSNNVIFSFNCIPFPNFYN